MRCYSSRFCVGFQKEYICINRNVPSKQRYMVFLFQEAFEILFQGFMLEKKLSLIKVLCASFSIKNLWLFQKMLKVCFLWMGWKFPREIMFHNSPNIPSVHIIISAYPINWIMKFSFIRFSCFPPSARPQLSFLSWGDINNDNDIFMSTLLRQLKPHWVFDRN